jgi:hypothetical protein
VPGPGSPSRPPHSNYIARHFTSLSLSPSFWSTSCLCFGRLAYWYCCNTYEKSTCQGCLHKIWKASEFLTSLHAAIQASALRMRLFYSQNKQALASCPAPGVHVRTIMRYLLAASYAVLLDFGPPAFGRQCAFLVHL